MRKTRANFFSFFTNFSDFLTNFLQNQRISCTFLQFSAIFTHFSCAFKPPFYQFAHLIDFSIDQTTARKDDNTLAKQSSTLEVAICVQQHQSGL